MVKSYKSELPLGHRWESLWNEEDSPEKSQSALVEGFFSPLGRRTAGKELLQNKRSGLIRRKLAFLFIP